MKLFFLNNHKCYISIFGAFLTEDTLSRFPICLILTSAVRALLYGKTESFESWFGEVSVD